MRVINSIFLVLGLVLGGANSYAQNCFTTKDIDTPFPLGAKAPIPWEEIDGYWNDYKGGKFQYRMEITDVLPDQSRYVKVDLLDETGAYIVATGVGFVRANSWDLWARIKGQEIDLKIRIQAFYEKNSTVPNRRMLVASIKDMAATNTPCLVRHALSKVDGLKNRTNPTPLPTIH